MSDLIQRIKDNLTDDLRNPEYRGHENPLHGHCYVASEALYHLLGAEASGFSATRVSHEGTTHWYLSSSDHDIIDITAGQFKAPVPYGEGVRTGFLTKQPSKRAQELMKRLKDD